MYPNQCQASISHYSCVFSALLSFFCAVLNQMTFTTRTHCQLSACFVETALLRLHIRTYNQTVHYIHRLLSHTMARTVYKSHTTATSIANVKLRYHIQVFVFTCVLRAANTKVRARESFYHVLFAICFHFDNKNKLNLTQ